MKEEILKKLIELENNTDFEVAHSEADDLLCEFLKSLGHNDIVEAYGKVGKWYA